MFTGIIRESRPVASIETREGLHRIVVDLGREGTRGLERGASVAIDGVCLTATEITETTAAFDVMGESLARTTLGDLSDTSRVHVERAAAFGDEIGGHLISGHVSGVAEVARIERPDENNFVLWLRVPDDLIDYVFEKGYIALAGASLTIVNVDRDDRTMSVWLIPETLRITQFGSLEVDDRVNVEIDAQTVAVVETVERVLKARQAT